MLRKSRERFSGVFVSKTISQDHSSLNWHSEPDFNRSLEKLIFLKDNGSKEKTTATLFPYLGMRAVPIHCKFDSL